MMQPMSSPKQLKLLALDKSDLDVISTVMQDALVPVGGLSFDHEAKTFALMGHRFCWEHAPKGEEEHHHRVQTGLLFENVEKVTYKGVDRREHQHDMLNLLAIRLEGNQITLHFSNNANIMLDITKFECRLKDMGEAWPTHLKPHHDIG